MVNSSRPGIMSSGSKPEPRAKDDVERIVARLEAKIATMPDRAELYRALWIHGSGIVAILAALEFLP